MVICSTAREIRRAIVTHGLVSLLDRRSRPDRKGKKEIVAKLPAFHIAPKPARDQLVGFLIHFHDTICPLIEAELGFPA